MSSRFHPLLAALLALSPLPWASEATAQLAYEKREVRIAMRDGVELFTAIYSPTDATRDYPILLRRTPYGARPYGPDEIPEVIGPSPAFDRDGYIFVVQDARGRFRSGGDFTHMRPMRSVAESPRETDESTDTWDTIEWLLRNVPNNNGRAGIWGISYPGFYAAAGMVEAHPALKAASPQAPQADWFAGDDIHHNGAFFPTSYFNFVYRCGRVAEPGAPMACGPGYEYPTLDGYRFWLDVGPLKNVDERILRGTAPGWTEAMEHGTYDAYWKARNILPHLRDVGPAVLAVGGWYDANNLYGALNVYRAVRRQSPGTEAFLAVGPWTHGQWYRDDGAAVGPLSFGGPTAPYFRDEVQLPFFRHYLKGEGELGLARATVFETGRNRWRRFDAWPPAEAEPSAFHLCARGAVSIGPSPDCAGEPFDEYASDPARPVPFVEGLSTDMDPDYMARDQRFAATRPDVLVYASEPLEEDVTIAGPVTPVLWVSSTGTDADFVVKLIDVHPDAPTEMGGFQEMVRGDVVRAKFRNSLERPEPLVPGEPTEVSFEMSDVLHTFRKGHRIMVQVQSSWFPLVDRNPQTFTDIYRASETDFVTATQRVIHDGQRMSRVEVRVLRANVSADGGR